jgi:tetratricopeptide (TPR) repeat protein
MAQKTAGRSLDGLSGGRAAPRRGWLMPLVLVGLTGLAAACGNGNEEDAILRGDRAWAAGDRDQALAEYRLAVRRGSSRGDGETLLRVAHAYASLNRVDEARDFYRQAVERDPELADQAVADLVRVARAAVERNDNIALASAVQGATEIRPGVSASELTLPLARHYLRSGQYGQAVPYFQKALSEDPDNTEILYDLATAHEEIGSCASALVFFERFREGVTARNRRDVDWRIGSCSFELAREARRDGGSEEALNLLQATIDLGEPRHLLSRAHFERGEILAAQGECEAAIEAFRRVREEDMAGSGVLSERAQRRIDEIRFGADEPPPRQNRVMRFLTGGRDETEPAFEGAPC